MKLLLSVAAGILAFFLSWKAQSSDWIQVKTNSPQIKQSVRKAEPRCKSSTSSRMMQEKKQLSYQTVYQCQKKKAPLQVLFSTNEESQGRHTKTPR